MPTLCKSAARSVILCFLIGFSLAMGPQQLAGVQADEPAAASPKTMTTDDSVRAKLDEKSSVQLIDVPLADALEKIKQLHKVEFQFDVKAMNYEGIGEDMPVSLDVKNISLRSVLRHLLRPLELTYIVADGALLITTPGVAATYHHTRVYPVGDLIHLKFPRSKDVDYGDDLVALLTSFISPDTWETVGGPGSVTFFHDTLLITQTDQGLEECEQLLAALRQLPHITHPEAGKSTAKIPVATPSAVSKKIAEALEQPISLQAKDRPLKEVAQLIASKCAIEVQLDVLPGEEVGVPADTHVSFECENCPLQSALNRLLRSVELTYLIRDEVLVFTTPEVEEQHLTTVLYPVLDLLELPEEAVPGDIQGEMDDLINTIQNLLAPDSWDAVGGMGTIASYNPRGVLVVYQTAGNQVEMETLLAKLRSSHGVNPPEHAVERPKLDETVVVIYELFYPEQPVQKERAAPVPPEHIDTEKLARLIPQLLGQDVWQQNEPVLLEGLADRLVVKQTRRVHRQIETLLHQLGVGFAARDPDVGGMQGMGGQSFLGGGIFNLPRK